MRFNDVIKELSGIEDVKAIILFGSFAKGEERSASDIDLLVLFENNNKAKENERKARELTRKYTERSMHLEVIGKEEIRKRYYIYDPILREGKVLYQAPSGLDTILDASTLFNLTPYVLCEIDMSSLNKKEKVEVSRALRGKKVKNYEYKGFVEVLNGKKLGKGVFLIPEPKEKEFDDFLNRWNLRVRVKKMKVWI